LAVVAVVAVVAIHLVAAGSATFSKHFLVVEVPRLVAADSVDQAALRAVKMLRPLPTFRL
jgi:hypothetical protein